MAQRIADARLTGMVFHSAEDLKLIKGIGEKLSARLDTLVLYHPSAEMIPESPDSCLSGNSQSFH